MRVTGGQSRGRLLSRLKGLRIRPSADKIRESIFNIIGQDMGGQNVLDLFAGTGSLGIEALSRGAFSCIFIDKSSQAISLIKKNLKTCGYEDSGFIIKKDLRTGLPRDLPMSGENVDLVFMDPPYSKGLVPRTLEKLLERRILSPGSLVVAESGRDDILPAGFGRLALADTRIYGETKISLYSFEGDK